MTQQVRDGLVYRDQVFEMKEGVFSPEQHGLYPGQDSSACWRGWMAGYAIRDGQLLLVSLTLAQPLQFLELDDDGNDISKPARYPPLNGVEAERLRGSLDGSWIFRDVNLPLDYTGLLTLCRLPRYADDPDYWEGRDNPDTGDYHHVLQLTLEKGRVVAEAVVSEPAGPASHEETPPPPQPVDPDTLGSFNPDPLDGIQGDDVLDNLDELFFPDGDKL